MSLEKIICPICRNEMKRGRVKQIFELDIKHDDGNTLPVPAVFFACMKCHNIQTFIEAGFPDSKYV